LNEEFRRCIFDSQFLHLVDMTYSVRFLDVSLKPFLRTALAKDINVAPIQNLSWTILPKQHWAIVGHNGVGKSTLTKGLLGQARFLSGTIQFNHVSSHDVSYYSFESERKHLAWQESIIERESFMGRHYEGDLVNQVVAEDDLLHALSLEHCLKRPMIRLSTGELKKVQIIRALQSHSKMMVFDEAFNGIDKKSLEIIFEYLDAYSKSNDTQFIFITHLYKHIPGFVDNILWLKENQQYEFLPANEWIPPHPQLNEFKSDDRKSDSLLHSILALSNTNVKFRGVQIIKDLSWNIQKGEQWLLVGPNGSGKSTLLDIIYGSNPQVYANDVLLFNEMRYGKGFSIFEIRKDVGYMSNKLHLNYSRLASVEEVILSGFQDVNAVVKTSPEQMQVCSNTIAYFGLEHIRKTSFMSLSEGQQRIVLLAKAVVQRPRLLLLDEPCSGLDVKTREQFLCLLRKMSDDVTIVFVTHSVDEWLGECTHVMEMNDGQVKFQGRKDRWKEINQST